MQQAIQYRTWPVKAPVSAAEIPIGRSYSSAITIAPTNTPPSVKKMVGENAVLVIGRRGCCMCHVMKRLLLGLGVNPGAYEVDDDEEEVGVVEELTSMNKICDGGNKDNRLQLPVVYIGGRMFGGLDRLMGAHITGELIPLLKQAGGLWL